tara:strand:- start:426 stop:947 length:522 start_codon:yes stop_codon:yes gene_type:complete
MKVNLRFTRASQETDGLGLGGEREVYQYDLDVTNPLLLIAECQHDNVCGTTITQGQALPSRPCPIKPTPDAVQWMCTGLHTCGWRGNNPTGGNCPKCQRRPVSPTPEHVRFAPMRIDACVDCPHASTAVIGLETDRNRVVEAFKQALATDADLATEDREIHRWEILWGQTTVG